ncbi:structure-specific endonuclease subunit SLX4 isoform X2 [Poecilia reticulata]|uniref:Structure-specific endonuclease subunit SLX4 n=1 Tax=Poecilia reticulata TaxID=8081 RepID=A0A3P9MSS1_POERE|nr:PREDICTED: structure-specific endonuclease subunit SLX4 isoform X2 [Poecilia reticulata]
MNDSELDFVDLCSKLQKRVRKKEPGRPSRKAEEQQSSSQTTRGDKRKVDKQDEDSLSGFSPTGSEVVCGGTGCDSGDAVQSSAVPPPDADLRAKDKVLLRMQEFKRASPQKMMHSNRIGPAKKDGCTLTAQDQKAGSATTIPTQTKPFLLSGGSDPRSEPPESDEALALRLQRELDREAAEAQIMHLEDGGLFFCQICHRDLSHMTPDGRTQHLNRCLDQNEQSVPSLPPPSAVPDCPICGKKFKSQKSRSAHLKRCSADMGISTAVLLQALQRQAEESRSSAVAANAHLETGGIKRKAPPEPALPARKKPRKKADRLDEDTMVALALSSSLLEQQKEQQVQSGGPHSSVTPLLTWKPDAAKGRVRKKKVAAPRPPPLLLVQDTETALARLQERVSALLLRRRAPSPPTPTRCPSKLPGWTGAAPLWRKSTLLDGGSTCPSQFYAAELQHLFATADLTKPDAALSSSSNNKPESSVPPALPSCSQTSSNSAPGTGELHVGSQAIRDLMELAEDGMTLTQYGYADKAEHLSGFIQEEESEDQAEPSDNTASSSSRAVRRTDQPEADRDAARHESVALSRLSSDLSSMVNNPQLSDLQLQVDSGEIYFAHSFMVYTRCPLLAEMVHESGFGVQEEGSAAAQRVLLSDVPGQAVLAVLRYLYTARCCIAASLRPHVLELASRFDLQELEQLCRFQPENMVAAAGDDGLDVNQEENVNNQTDRAFVELLRSMWNEEDSDGGGRSEEDRPEDEVATGDGEIGEERVNEQELEEIYEFAATQRQRVKEEEEEKDAEPEPGSDRSYSRLFSQSWGVYHDGEASSSPPLLPHEASPKHSARTLLQSSASVADEPSLNLPVPGPSPGRPAPEDRHGQGEEAAAESRARRSATPSPARRDEAELIVLSDSSEEAEADRSFTGIKPGQNPSPTESVCGSQFSPGDPVGCSPELSWLVPSTPVRSPVRSTRAASMQTDSSMCRTRLFPKVDPSPAFSPSRNTVPTSSTPLKASTERQVSPDKRRSSEAFAANRPFRDSSKHEAPLQPRSISSTLLNANPERQSTSGQMKARTCVSNSSGQSLSSSPVESSEQPGVSNTSEVTSVPDVRDSSLQQSFMDEPPIAFNDSWGLDACADGDLGGFSLKLDNTQESSSGGRPGASRPTAASSVQNPAAGPGPLTTPEVHNDLLDSEIWGSWEGDGGAGEEEDEEEEEGLPLSQRANLAARLQTPKSWKQTRRRPPGPITPMPHYSDMDTPELKNKLSSFGVRPLPKRQMVLKLKEIHQYTHQLTSSEEEEEEEEAPLGRAVSCARFKEPMAAAPAAAASPVKTDQEEAGDPLSASQGSNASSTAASDELERSNPELVLSSDGDSDSDVSSSQAASRLQDRLQAVRSFILSESDLYSRILQYQPLVLSQLQQQLKAAGIRLGAAKLVDYLDSQCITFTTAKPGHHAAGRRRGAWTGRGTGGGGRKNGALKR